MDYQFIFQWIFSLAPILVVLVLMIVFGWSGGRAGAAGWFTALIVSISFFGANARVLAFAQMKAVLLSLYVLYIVWMALVLYYVVNETGAIRTIGNGIRKLTQNKSVQLLILGWVFSSFLQGVAGFGVPIAVVAPLILGLGFSPVLAVAVPAIGHSWSVTFGDMASSFQALIAVTGLDGLYLAHWSALFLAVTVYLCGIGVVYIYGGFASIRESLVAILIIGTVMACTQYFLAISGLWTLAGFGAGIAGLLISIFVARLPLYRPDSSVYNRDSEADDDSQISLFSALSAYLILIILVTVAEVYEPVHTFLNEIKVSFYFPEIRTPDWVVSAGYGKNISVFGHAGALLTYTSILSYLVYKVKGYYRPDAIKQILSQTLRSGVPTSIGIVSMVSFAMIMDQCGMTYLLAEGICKIFGPTYPLFASAIGTLGAFMTGSNTNSNVVFGMLQKQTAQLLSLNAAVILGAQTAGGSIGSMLAPAKILVGCSTVGLSGNEGPVLGKTLKYGIVITLIIGLMAFISAHAVQL